MKTKTQDDELLFAVKTVATLLALQEYKGDKKSPAALSHSMATVYSMIEVFRKIHNTPSTPGQQASALEQVALRQAADLLGMNASGVPRVWTPAEIAAFVRTGGKPSSS